MGYGSYETSRGLAGYGVDDVCHWEGCEVEIDRGLAYLCGTDPHSPDLGCGWWFCGQHLTFAPEEVEYCDSLCRACSARWQQDHPEADDEDE